MEANIVQQFKLMLSCIREIPTFDGTDPNQLPDFFSQVESLLPSIDEFQEINQKFYLGT